MSMLQNEVVFNYEELVSRNYGFISEGVQHKIRSYRLMFAGCGLASVIAEAAVRVGFENIILLDHDQVELSNLNRQNFHFSDLTENKAKSLSARLLKINPNLNLQFFPEAISSNQQILNLISQVDVVINTIDYDAAYFDLVELTRAADKLVVCPFNPCDSGMVVFFNKESQSIYEFLQTRQPLLGLDFPTRLRELYTPTQLPSKVRDKLTELLPLITQKKYYPQLILGAHITTAIVMNYLIKYLNAEAIPLAPELIYREV